VAVAIVNGLVDLAWQAYEQSAHSSGWSDLGLPTT
jgi:hypothetical protein